MPKRMAMVALAAFLVAGAVHARGPAMADAATAREWPVVERDHVLKGFRFATGETMDVRMHYRTLGTPKRDAKGRVTNAVMILHGTGGAGTQFLQPHFADMLYADGAPFDLKTTYVILPDNIGHGGSSKPSDGMRMAFPRYDYDDMVDAQKRLLSEALAVDRPRLILGTSMGCMHAFVWGARYPQAARALMPLACLPVEIAGINRAWRQLVIDGIKADPGWAGGNYTQQPAMGLRNAASIMIVAGAAPLALQRQYPTRADAERYATERLAAATRTLDANDMIYQFDSSRNYNPWPTLERIAAPVTWINSADDFINPRNFPFPAEAVKRMPDARFRMIEESDQSFGHSTHTHARFWIDDLRDLMARSEG
ncbi:alpha/beta fold hydrolase [Sphingomonas sp.]